MQGSLIARASRRRARVIHSGDIEFLQEAAAQFVSKQAAVSKPR